MKLYETTFIINPQTDDATINRYVQDISSLITGNDGKIVREDHMGTRRLAYDINGLTQGYYASFIFEAPTKVLPLLDRHYKLNESYIRNLTVCFEGDPDKMTGQDDVFGRPSQDDSRDKDNRVTPYEKKVEKAVKVEEAVPEKAESNAEEQVTDDNAEKNVSESEEEKTDDDSEL